MSIEISKADHEQAVASLQRYAAEYLDEPLGSLLQFFLEEIGPAIYNQAISDAQTRLTQRVADLNGELYADEFQYWPRNDAKRKSRR